jgi:hypothetical protein
VGDWVDMRKKQKIGWKIMKGGDLVLHAEHDFHFHFCTTPYDTIEGTWA